MILSIMVYQPVRVIYPATASSKMELRTVRFPIKAVMSGYKIILVYFT